MLTQQREVAGFHARLGAHPPIPRSVVKSAGRVLQIIGFFDDVRRAASVGEISDTLNFPQSSTSLLLRSMLEMGYLRYEEATRTYVPTSRLALTGSWISHQLIDKGPLLRAMEQLHEETGNAVIISMRHGIHMQYIHVVQAIARVGHLIVGTQRHLTATGSGHVLLSMLADRQVSRLALAINARRRSDTPPLRVADVLATVARIRVEGHFFASSISVEGCASISLPLRRWSPEEPMAIAVIGQSEDVGRDRVSILQAMRRVMEVAEAT